MIKRQSKILNFKYKFRLIFEFIAETLVFSSHTKDRNGYQYYILIKTSYYR